MHDAHPNQARSKRGFLLVEAIVGMVVLGVIIGGIIVALRAQTLAASRTVRRARCRLVLEGEIEIMRGRPHSDLEACEKEPFEPELDPLKGLDEVSFYKTVERGENGLVRVRLWATKKRGPKTVEWMSLESCIFSPRESRGEKTST